MWGCNWRNRLCANVNPDADLAWRDLVPRVRFHSDWNVERRGTNTLPLSGTRQAMWHLSKRRGGEVGDVVGVVSEAPRDKVWEEVKGAGWSWERMFVAENSNSRLDRVNARCSPENQRLSVE